MLAFPKHAYKQWICFPLFHVTIILHSQCLTNPYLYLLTFAIQPQMQLATEVEKRETNMHPYKKAKTRLDVDVKMIDDELYDMR